MGLGESEAGETDDLVEYAGGDVFRDPFGRRPFDEALLLALHRLP